MLFKGNTCICVTQVRGLTAKSENKTVTSLYERLGGEAAIDAAVDRFYDKVLADDRINHFFAETDMIRQKRHQKQFLTFAFGGSQNYSGKGMREAHRKLVEDKGLNDSHFDAVIENLGATLTELGVSDSLVREVAETADTLRNDVLNR